MAALQPLWRSKRRLFLRLRLGRILCFFAAQNARIAECTTKLAQLHEDEDVVTERNHKKKRAFSGKGQEACSDNSENSADESADESALKRRKQRNDADDDDLGHFFLAVH